nr:MAG TPA: prohead serine protease [Caudoviricetes sp.]
MKRVRISNNSLNSYGSRVLTEGMDVRQYCRNPVLLYMHERGNVIGYVKDLKVENDEVTGELMFDEATELSRRCKKQWEFGSLKMVSVGIDIVEESEAPEVIVPGQKYKTITKSKLFEVSVVDVGANDDAIVMRKNGEQITLGKDGKNPLTLLSNKQQDNKQMEQKLLCAQLGLPETADEATILQKINSLKEAETEKKTLAKEKAQLTLSAITTAVETAITEKRIGEDKKEHFINLGKKIGVEDLKQTFAAMSPMVKLSAVVGHQGDTPPRQAKTYQKLSEVPEAELEELRSENVSEYKRLYKAEYGMECEI